MYKFIKFQMLFTVLGNIIVSKGICIVFFFFNKIINAKLNIFKYWFWLPWLLENLNKSRI